MAWIRLDPFFAIAGALLVAVAIRIATDATHPRRSGSAAFWFLLGTCMIAGARLSSEVVGYAVLAMTGLAATRQVAAPEFRRPSAAALERRAAELGSALLSPMLLVPAMAITGGLLLGRWIVGGLPVALPAQASQVALGIGSLAGLGLALRLTRDQPIAAIDEGGRLLQWLGWTLILPQMLATLGGIFAKAGVGDQLAAAVSTVLPVQIPLVAVVAYCGGMALLTILMGNAFAAFPVMTLAIGVPFLVRAQGANPAIVGTLGMLSGYCGTLVTPMAANFNIVPVRLLELRSDAAVIRAQAPFAAAIWLFNVALLIWAI